MSRVQTIRFYDIGATYPEYADFDANELDKPPAPLMINVLVYDGETLIRSHKKNFKNKKVRLWINNVILWAVKNGKRVEISKGQ